MPLLWVSLSFVSGILLSAALAGAGQRLAWPLWAVLALLPPALGLFLRYRRRTPGWLLHRLPRLALPPAVLAAALLLGAARFEAAQPNIQADHIAWLNGKGPAVISGWISAPVEPGGESTLVRLKVETAGLADENGNASPQPIKGTILVRLTGSKTWNYGDRLTVRGALQQPPEWDGFSYRDYLARQGVYAWVPYSRAELEGTGAGSPILAAVYTLRQRLYTGIQQNFPAPESELLAGILLGIDRGIPEDVGEAFKVTGTAHIIAISGFNMAVIAGLFTLLFTRLAGARRGLLLTLLGLAFYTVLAGASASVIRAAVMGSLGLYGRQIGRRQAGANSLMFTALVMCLINPTWLWDVGFQLSFAATLGLILYAAPLEALVLRQVQSRLPQETARRLTRFIAEYFLLTLAAQVITLPMMAFHFGRLSLTSFLVNPLILPAQPPVMILGGLAALLDLVSRPLAGLAAAAAWPFLAYTIHMVEWWARIPGGSLYTGQASIWLALFYYAVLVSLTAFRGRLSVLKPKIRPALALLITAALAAAVWRQALAVPNGRLVLEVLPSGETPALLLKTPAGRSLLIGAGGDQSRLAAGVGRRLPLWGNQLDGVVIADPAGLSRSIEQYRPAWALWMEVSPSSGAEDLRAVLARGNVQEADAVPGQAIDLGSGALLEILQASRDEPLMRITWQRFSIWVLAKGDPLPAGLSIPDGSLVILLGDPGDGVLPAQLERARILRAPPGGWLRITSDGMQIRLEEGL